MSYERNWLHCVWGTKDRIPIISSSNKSEILNHIIENAKSKGIFIKTINGYKEHIHCLLSLKPEQSLARIIQLIKGESSFWINRNYAIQNLSGPVNILQFQLANHWLKKSKRIF